jgi:hypothetical protein
MVAFAGTQGGQVALVKFSKRGRRVTNWVTIAIVVEDTSLLGSASGLPFGLDVETSITCEPVSVGVQVPESVKLEDPNPGMLSPVIVSVLVVPPSMFQLTSTEIIVPPP